MRPAPPEDRQRIIDLYENGMTRPAIARETGWSKGTVDNIIKAAGVQGAGRVTGIRTDPATEARVMAMYEQGVTWREIQRHTGRTEHTVSAIIKRNGGDLGRRAEFSDEDRQRIAGLYAGGMDAPEISRLMGCSTSGVYSAMDSLGLSRREQVACEREDFFDSVDTPEKAYWLGFIAADGCVRNPGGGRYYRLVIKLARKDRDHLVLLHTALRARRPIRDNDQWSKGQMRPYSTLDVCSDRLARALAGHGIIPRKTNELDPWDGPPGLMPHYWRGLVDGDGSITINHNGVYVSLVGSEAVVRGFLAWAHDVSGTNAQPRQGTQGNRRYWTTQIGGTRLVLHLLAALYDDAPVALARKKALADLAVHGKPLQAAIF